MPTFIHSKESRIAIGSYDLSDVVTDVSESVTVDTAETTTLVDDDKAFVAGHRDQKLSVKGVADFATLAKDQNTLRANLASTARAITTYCPQGYTVGNVAKLMQATPESYNVTSPAQDVVRFDSNMVVRWSTKSDAGKHHHDNRGLVLFYSTGASTSTSAAASQDAGAASTKGYAAHVHLFSGLGGGTITFQVQHSSNGSAWSDLSTFAAFSAFGSQRLTSTSASVKRYVRGAITSANSTVEVSALVAFARRTSA